MLQADDIHKSYTNGKETLEVLKGISLQVDKGSFVAIAGPSGAGKSTLLHILGGLDSPTQGTVLFDRQDMYGMSQGQVGRLRNLRIGFVFQFYHLLPEFTVQENVLMPALVAAASGAPQAQAQTRACQLLDQVGLAQRRGHFPNQLSGGEKQRVAIVRALMNQPQVLFCDEPTGNLDSQTGEGIIGLLKELNRTQGMTIVLVTHNQELVKMADHRYHLRDGIVVS